MEAVVGGNTGGRKEQREPSGEFKNMTSAVILEPGVQEQIREKDRTIVEQKRVIDHLRLELESHKKKVEELESDMDDKDKFGESSQTESSCSKTGQSRYWTAEEHQKFLEAIRKYGDKDVKSIAAYVGTRNATQVRTHGQKYFQRLEREKRKKDEEARQNQLSLGAANCDEKGKSSKKKAQYAKRRKSMGDFPQSIIPRQSNQNVIPASPQPPVIPHFIQQQIAAETKDNVLNALKGWSHNEYNNFIQGLVMYSEEKDINVRCKLIADHYLPTFTADEIKHCFLVLSNVAKAKERDEPHDEFANMEARAKADIFAHYQQTMKGSAESQEVIPLRFAAGVSIYTRYNCAANNYPSDVYPVYSGNPFASFHDQRRASFPMDGANVKIKYPDPADQFYPVENGEVDFEVSQEQM